MFRLLYLSSSMEEDVTVDVLEGGLWRLTGGHEGVLLWGIYVNMTNNNNLTDLCISVTLYMHYWLV